ncbi:apoptosis-enhancing nuclease [Trichomycterus rosablanca]|uniref:apoptosis-enhancing nuclease n=1 Tax=Trichomycterus rosablanca TaxID=2290929 RepID=UPI002F35D149
MSISALCNDMTGRTAWGPLNAGPAAFCSISAKTHRKRKHKKKKRNKTGIDQESPHEPNKSNKRKQSETLEQLSSSHSICSTLSTCSNSSQDCNQVCKAKRAKISSIPGSTSDSECTVSVTDNWEVDSGFSSEISPPSSGRSSPCFGVQHSMLVALDCEMVGTGLKGQFSELARCSLLNYSGTVIYDKYILPCQPVTDYRTKWSGIKKEHLMHALPYNEARDEILHILKGKIIIGHSLRHDFAVLGITVPHHMIRDTSSIQLLRQMYGESYKSISLKRLSWKFLNRRIQVGTNGHCSVEDARAALDLYKLVEEQWEKSLQGHSDVSTQSTSSMEHYMQDQYWPESLMDCS